MVSAVADGEQVVGACVPVWRVAESPVVTDGRLNAVAARTSTDVWTVGGIDSAPEPFGGFRAQATPLLEHWDGTAWSVVAGPAVQGVLRDVASVSAADVWAVGSGGLIERWNGQTWKTVFSPWRVDFAAVAASSARDVWAVGYDGTGAAILHWNGHAWSRTRWRGAQLDDVVTLSGRDVWAVGESADNKPLALHWNGVAWRAFVRPAPYDAALSTVTASATGGVWAAGYTRESWSMINQFVLHWDGRQWKTTPSASGGYDDFPTAIAARTPNEIWLASQGSGYFFGWDRRGRVRHLNANVWTTTSLDEGQLLRGLATDPTGALWAVGFTGSGEVPEPWGGFPLHTVPLIERYGC
jgi:hypothetical protein